MCQASHRGQADNFALSSWILTVVDVTSEGGLGNTSGVPN